MVLMTVCLKSFGCAWSVTHNYYLFSVVDRTQYDDSYPQEWNKYWQEYMGSKKDEYDLKDIIARAQKKGDNEMLTYAQLLKKYIDICDDVTEEWEYPTKAELAQRRQMLTNIHNQADAYAGSRLRSRYALLLMRTNMLMQNYAENIAYWKNTASRLTPSSLRNVMESIYANAELHAGSRVKAIDTYARLGDFKSLKWAVRKMRNRAGIQTIYAENPNSPVLPFLVQDYVNCYQETQDNTPDRKDSPEGWQKNQPILKDATPFIQFANRVIKEGKTSVPALWQSAVGALQFYSGDAASVQTLTRAMQMKGTAAMTDNARAMRIIANARFAKLDNAYESSLVKELQWLDGKIRTAPASRSYVDDEAIARNKNYHLEGLVHNQFSRIKDRLCYQELSPRLEKAGRLSTALALIDIESGQSSSASMQKNNFSYSSEFAYKLREMRAADVEEYYKYLLRGGDSTLDKYICTRLNKDNDYYSDLIGTKYLSEGEFGKAKPYLEKTSLRALGSENVAGYFGKRKYTTEEWFHYDHLFNGDSYCYDVDNPSFVPLKSNQRLEFCNDMIALKQQYDTSSGDRKCEAAYRLGTYAFRASHVGQCWWLSGYEYHFADTITAGRKDLGNLAYKWLSEAAKSTNDKIKGCALCGLSYLPMDEWQQYDWSTDRYLLVRSSKSYNSKLALCRYLKSHPSSYAAEQLSRCDVLKEFRKTAGV